MLKFINSTFLRAQFSMAWNPNFNHYAWNFYCSSLSEILPPASISKK